MKKSLLLIALLLAPIVAASSLYFTSPATMNGCQCDPQSFTLELYNQAAHGEVFTLSIQTDSETFSTFVTPTVESQPGSKNTVLAFMTPHCDALPGTYAFTIRAVGSAGTTLTSQGFSVVQECHYLLLQFTPEQSVCSGEEARFDITLENAGYFPEAGSLFTDLDPQLYTLANSSFSLQPEASKQFHLYVTPPNEMPPQTLTFKVNASSFYTYRESYAVLHVTDCSHLLIDMPEACIAVNPGEQVTEYYTLTNPGIADSFDLELLCPAFVTTSVDEVTLASGESITLPLYINPSQQHLNQDYACSVRATSQRYGKHFTESTEICVQKLYDVDLWTDLSGNSLTICEGDSASIPFHLRNEGKNAEYQLQTTVGSLSDSSFYLSAGQEALFTVAVPSTMSVGRHDVTVTASNQFHTETETVRLTVEKCYDSSMSLGGSTMQICPGETLSTSATLYNKGTRADDYSISVNAPSEFSVIAQPGQLSILALSNKQFALTVSALYTAQYGTQRQIEVIAQDGTASSATLSIELLAHNVCHNLLVTPDGLKEVEVCQGNTFDVLLTNKGRFTESLELTLEGPNWAFVTPPSIIIEPGESKHAYVFFSPPFSTQPGIYDLTLRASNDHVSGTANLQVKVYPVGGLGHQIPNYTTQDYVLEFTVPTSVEFEYGASRTLEFTVKNNGIAPLNNIMLYFENDDLRVLNESMAPFGLMPGQQRVISVELEPERDYGAYATMFRAVAREKFVERSVTYSVAPRSVLVELLRQDYYMDGNESFTIAQLNVTNNGSVAMVFEPTARFTGNYSFEPESLSLEPGGSAILKLSLPEPTEANATVSTRLEAGDSAYFDDIVIQPAPIGVTGLFSGAVTAAALVLAFVILMGLYYWVTGGSKPSKAPKAPSKKRGGKAKRKR